MPDFAMPRATKGLRPHTDERTSAWVVFPHLQQIFLLPIIKRQRRIIPFMADDGTVTISTEDPNPALAKLVDDFVLSTVRAKGDLSFTLEAFGDFIRLVKALVLANYDLPDTEVMKSLAMNERDISIFYSNIFLHCQSS